MEDVNVTHSLVLYLLLLECIIKEVIMQIIHDLFSVECGECYDCHKCVMNL